MTRREKMLAWGLALSLGINVAIIAFAATMAFRGLPPLPPMGPALFRVLSQDLSEDGRREMRHAARSRRPEAVAAIGGVRGARDRAVAALAAERFDQEAFEAAMADLRGSVAHLQTEIHGGLGAAAAAMSRADRAALGETLARMLRPGQRRGGRRDSDQDRDWRDARPSGAGAIPDRGFEATGRPPPTQPGGVPTERVE